MRFYMSVDGGKKAIYFIIHIRTVLELGLEVNDMF